MPVAAKVRVMVRHDHNVPHPRRDRLLATRTHIRLDSPKRLHEAHLSPVVKRTGELRQAIPGFSLPSGTTCHPYIVGLADLLLVRRSH